jgi:DNA-binding MarR family transcriptional regulator
MSTRVPVLAGHERPRNLVVQLREAFTALNDLFVPHLVERGFTDFRPAHGAVFQYLDDTGTTVSTLANRAQMTKQAMAELVGHLERSGYVVRVPDPDDRRAKRVLPTERGRDVVDVAQQVAPQIEERVGRLIGAERLRELRADLETIRADFAAADARYDERSRNSAT